MGGLSVVHLLILLVIVLIFFGPGKLPALGESLGKAIRGFKDSLDETNRTLNARVDEKPQPSSQDSGQAAVPPASQVDEASGPVQEPLDATSETVSSSQDPKNKPS